MARRDEFVRNLLRGFESLEETNCTCKPSYAEIENFLKQSIIGRIPRSCIILRSPELRYLSLKEFIEDTLDKFPETPTFAHLDGILFHTPQIALEELVSQIFTSEEMSDFKKSSCCVQLSSLHQWLGETKTKTFIMVQNMDLVCELGNQSFLYVLLDSCRNNENVMFIGDTVNVGIVDLFEKRVKSRFSQQIYHLHHVISSEEIFRILSDVLNHPGASDDFRRSAKIALDDEKVLNALKRFSYFSNTYAEFRKLLLLIINNVASSSPKESILSAVRSMTSCSDYELLSGLSAIEVTIIFLAYRYIQDCRGKHFTTSLLFKKLEDFTSSSGYHLLLVSNAYFETLVQKLCRVGIFNKALNQEGTFCFGIEASSVAEFIKSSEGIPLPLKSLM